MSWGMLPFDLQQFDEQAHHGLRAGKLCETSFLGKLCGLSRGACFACLSYSWCRDDRFLPLLWARELLEVGDC